MDEAKAREILGNMVQPNGDLVFDDDGNKLRWEMGCHTVGIEHNLTAEQLEAIAWWIRNKANPAGE